MKHKIFAICGFNILDNIVSNEIKFSGIFWYFQDTDKTVESL